MGLPFATPPCHGTFCIRVQQFVGWGWQWDSWARPPLTPPLHLSFARYSLHICSNWTIHHKCNLRGGGVQFAKSVCNIFTVSFLSEVFVDKVHGAVAGGEAWGEADTGPALRVATFARLALPCQAFHTFVPTTPCHKGCQRCKRKPESTWIHGKLHLGDCSNVLAKKRGVVVVVGWGLRELWNRIFWRKFTRFFFFQKKGLGAVVETWGDQRARQEKEGF